jgi:site-specific recombinase XerD
MTHRRNHYLEQRGHYWYYKRRVPARYADIDTRRFSKSALHTDSLSVARTRRDAMADADEAFWGSAWLEKHGTEIPSQEVGSAAACRHRSAKRLAKAMGFVFKPITALAEKAPLEDIADRAAAIGGGQSFEREAEAVLGLTEQPSMRVSEALDLFFDKLVVSQIRKKSPDQVDKWKLPKKRSIARFIDLCGDLPMNQIERSHARAFYDLWGERLAPKDGAKGMKPNSANRELGNLRKLYRDYWTYEGQENRENPFRNLRFANEDVETTPAFSDDWVRERILKPGVFDGLNREAKLIVYALIETGCRPSEIANLAPEDIRLDAEVPHISICPKQKRELKTKISRREIPLVGVSLAAIRQAPQGFPRYRERGYLLSASLMKAFKARDLLEVEGQRIYSFRNSFEKRMLEAGLDYGLRCTLMGHKNNRPEYGDGGSLEFRRNELERIAYELPKLLFRNG